ncbi:MACPF domain-containing protein [Zostera marina]|uniref:MACPF domain-containing protein n=1 Tax=Zostera marina TaxID=29655 RepID=A0A0K9PRM8_ZOSMR|nr:MACPF domain-containing protein [Zostera marina]
MAFKGSPYKAAEAAISAIGLGFDISNDIQLGYRKEEASCLIELAYGDTHNVVLPGGITVPKVSKSIKVDKGERVHYTSDILNFQQMSENFNRELNISGKIPSGLFNTMFRFSHSWQKDAASTKSLAYDGWFITLYTVALSKSQIILREHVKEAVPSSWDPMALGSFIQKFGTHIIVGVKMGGKDVIYMRQSYSSPLQPAEIQKRLKEIADERFLDANGRFGERPINNNINAKVGGQLRFADYTSPSSSYTSKELQDVTIFMQRRGGKYNSPSHADWLQTVQSHPDVISMATVPITSLLSGVPGSGFLSHAINLYLRYKPQIEELHQFLEFQLPRHWAPVFSELPLGPQRKAQSTSSLSFNIMGPKLYVNTSRVDVDRRPVTGLRLYLEGKRGNRLAIHLQHLSSLPQILKLEEDLNNSFHFEGIDKHYYEPIQWKHFSHICTVPVESDDDNSIVTGAELEVGSMGGYKKVLFLRLYYSRVLNMTHAKSEWDESPQLTQKSGLISTLISTRFSSTLQKTPVPPPEDVNINSAVFPRGPPMTVQSPRLLKLIDTKEISRGPQDLPGYWMVSGAKLNLVKGKISLRVKFSCFTAIHDDDEEELM